jgi:hypothetical protein
MTVGTNVPSPTFGASGFVAPSGPAILAGCQADIDAAFGKTLNYKITTPQGQIAQSNAAIISNNYDIFVYYSQQFDPAYAVGRSQDAIGRIYFLERDPAEPTTLQIACSGLEGVVIPAGTTPALIKDVSGNIYQCIQAGTIPSGGSITLSFAAKIPGPTAVPGASDVKIYQAIPGWDSVAVVSGVVGKNVESRSEFEQRRRDSVAGNSFGPIGAIIGAVAKVAGVLDYFGYNNNTSGSVTVGGVAIAAYSIYICVAGGATDDVAKAIFSKKGAGAPMVGTTTVTVYDDNPLYAAPIPYTIKYQIPSALQVLFKVVVVSGPLVPSDAGLQIQNAILSAFGGAVANIPKARINSTIIAIGYIPAIAALGPWAQLSSITVGSANTPGAVVTGRISGSTLTVDSVVSGAVAVDQALSDPSTLIENATYVTAFGTGGGGTGTYTVNQPQTIGATFTGTGSGTNLTAASVSGVISVGDVITGTGVPANTTIVSQTSGTPGGAGVYVTNNATTSSGASLKSSRPITLAAANQSLVVVQADQSPQLTAANIEVTTT